MACGNFAYVSAKADLVVARREGITQRFVRRRCLQTRETVVRCRSSCQIHRRHGRCALHLGAHVYHGFASDSHKKSGHHDGRSRTVRLGLFDSSQVGERSNLFGYGWICGCSHGVCRIDLFTATVVRIGRVGSLSQFSFESRNVDRVVFFLSFTADHRSIIHRSIPQLVNLPGRRGR
jgi:hypothetical protein